MSSAPRPAPRPNSSTIGSVVVVVVELVVASQIIDEVELSEDDVVDGEGNSGLDDDDDDDDELLVPKSPTPVQDEFCSFDDTDDNTDFEDVESGAGGAGGRGGLGLGMTKVFASVLDVDDGESQEDDEDDDDDGQPPSLPPTLPPVLIVTDDADVVPAASACPSPQPSIISRPVSTTGVVLHSLVYAPRPYSAPKNINPS